MVSSDVFAYDDVTYQAWNEEKKPTCLAAWKIKR